MRARSPAPGIIAGQHDPMLTVDLLAQDIGYLLADTQTAPGDEAV